MKRGRCSLLLFCKKKKKSIDKYLDKKKKNDKLIYLLRVMVGLCLP